jgi:NAD dependent epimerase/dehydratase
MESLQNQRSERGFSNKKVLVTGADGFIGSHLTELLVDQGSDVRALAQYNSFNTWGWLDRLSNLEKVEVVCGDIRDPNYCHNIVRGVDIIFHLAALVAVPYSYLAPESYISTNIGGTLNMCQAALNAGCERFIQMSTSEIYGTAQYVPIDEKHLPQPQSPYSASKVGADAIVNSFNQSFEFPGIIARPFNTFGPRQSARAVVPTIIMQLVNNAPVIALGDLSPTRDYTYVEDTCRALVALAINDNCIGETVNIGSNEEISVGMLLDCVQEIMGKNVEAVIDQQRIRPRNSEVLRLHCDNTKLKSLTGYVNKFTLKQGLQKTIEWFEQPANIQKYKSDIFNI